ncbi:AAA family ATPase [Ornithinimicrobium cavernae]|uniref:AAA family ATPase n=1 Tax=Ornithinimicrobium cavernae TaxID=2666047 RepID=UPI00192A57FF|nr:AAA family ATPase [Ornithinimicrobium cavernae]
MSAPRLVGRDRQLTTLTDALTRSPAVVLVEGEAGIGKSRLVQEALTADPTARRTRLMAVCPPFRESLTLGPVVDALRAAQPTLAGVVLTELAGALRPLFPEWSADLPPAPGPLDDATASRHRLFRALTELVRALGVDLLVVEDVQWADEVTLEFLLFLTSRHEADRPDLVLTYRPEDLDDQSLLLRLSSRLPAGTTQVRILLAPLDRDGTASLVSSMLDRRPMSEEFAAFLHERTDGIPLAVEESVRLLCDRADLVFRAGTWVRLSLSDLQVPPTVRDSTRERVGRLSTSAQAVLRAAAALGEPHSEQVISATTGLGPAGCRAGLADAAAAGLLDGDDRGRWRFRHGLAATAVYESIPAPERRLLHGRAGRALAGLSPQPIAQLARHFREAGDDSSWVTYAEQTAHRAIDSGDHTSAVLHLDDLLSTADIPPSDRPRIARTAALAALGRRETVDEIYHHLVRTLRRTLESTDLSDRQQGEIRNYLGRLLINTGEAEAALAELEQAVAHLGHDPVEAAKVMTYLGWAFAGPWPASTHLRWLQRAAELVPAIHSPADRLSLAGNRAAALLMLGEEAAWDAIADLPADASSPAERLDIARINANIGTGALLWGRYSDAGRHLAHALLLAESEKSERLQNNIRLEQANLDWFTGRWEGLAERAEELGELNRDRPGAYLASVRLSARLAAARGRRRTAQEQFRLALDEATRLGALDDTLEPAAALARLSLGDGEPGKALRVTESPLRMVEEKRVWVWATEIAPVRVEALIAAGDPAGARRLTTRLARGLRHRNAPGARAALTLCRALLLAADGDHHRTARAFARAARAWDALPRPYDALLARERQAGALLSAGGDQAGRELLTAVYEQLFRLGARGDADRVAQELRANDAAVPRPWRGGRRGYGDRLSPRELEVVRLVVAGKTNREIGRILSKSPATVEQQVRSAMRKLSAPSRTALAVRAVETGVFAEDTGYLSGS